MAPHSSDVGVVCVELVKIGLEGQNCKLLEQNVFNIITLNFDDNKVLKSQLDVLIFVQVCRTIDKNL